MDGGSNKHGCAGFTIELDLRVGELNLDRTFGVSQAGNRFSNFRLAFQGGGIRAVGDLDKSVSIKKEGTALMVIRWSSGFSFLNEASAASFWRVRSICFSGGGKNRVHPQMPRPTRTMKRRTDFGAVNLNIMIF